MTDKQVTLNQILTDAEVKRCIKWWREDRQDRRVFRRRVLEQIIEPNMDRINKSLGQPNDARFLSYAVEYIMTCGLPEKKK